MASGVEREPVVADLAAMKAGMPHGGILWLRDLPDPEQASARVVRDFVVVATTPGAAVNYSNYTSGLLERVVAHASGTDFTAFVQERIVEPLGMTRTVPSPLLVPAHTQVATVFSDDRAMPIPPLFTPIGGQGYYSCAANLTTLAHAHLGRRRPEEAGPSAAALAASRWPTDPGRLGPADHLWMGWGRFGGEAGLFELTNGQVMSSTSALLLCVEKGAGVVCLTNSQWASRPGGERLADSIAFQVMDVLVPGCTRAYSEAAARAEALERTVVLPAADRAACVGEWEGELVLGEQRFAARLHVTPELSATLFLDDYEARCGQLQFQGPEIVGDFASSQELRFFGESGRLSQLSVVLRVDVEARRLAGHVLASTYSTGRATVGSGAGLLTLRKRGAIDASQPR